jgi:KipI family sensor histidine kinase inhibitor
MPVELLPYGDDVLLIRWYVPGTVPDPATVEEVDAWARRIRAAGIPGVQQVFPAFDSLAVIYDPVRLSYDQLAERIRQLDRQLPPEAAATVPLLEVPVVYGGEYGPDLPSVAKACGLSEEEVVDIHTGKPYKVWMIGFLSGFPYAGALDERLVLPRKASPSLSVRAGSVAIAGNLTGIYPLASPGGWHVIGWTPWAIFDLKREPPALFQAGYRIRFRAIPEAEADLHRNGPSAWQDAARDESRPGICLKTSDGGNHR